MLWNTIIYTTRQTLLLKFHFHLPKNLGFNSSKAILVLDNVGLRNFVSISDVQISYAALC